MKALILFCQILLLAGTVTAADLSTVIAEAAKYESGGSAVALRQIEQAVRESAGNPARRAEVEGALVKLMQPSSTYEARRFACTQLAIIGTDASLSAIAELLKHPDTVAIATAALGSNPSPKVNEILRAALTDAPAQCRAQIIVTLGDRRDSQSVPAIATSARSTEPDLRDAAIGALGKIANDEALTELADLRRKPDAAPVALTSSLVAADLSAKSGKPTDANAIYDELLANNHPAFVRRAAFEGLLRLDKDGGEKRVLQTLHGKDALLKAPAIAHVRNLKSSAASATFAKEMRALTPAEQVQMIETLAARKDEPAKKAITAELAAEDPAVRQAAVLAFVEIGDASSVSALADALNSAGTSAQQQTMEMAMASLKGGVTVDQAIISLLKSRREVPRVALINVLARRGSQVAVPILLAEAGSADATTARASFRALGKLAKPDHLDEVLEMLVELRAPAALGDAENAAGVLLERETDSNKRYTAVSAAMKKSRGIESRCALIRLLPVCGGPQALAAVNAARSDKEAHVREAAFRALTAWPDAAAFEPLLQIAQSPAPNSERVLALRGYVRLLGTSGEPGELVPRFQKAMTVAKDLNEGKLVLGSLARVDDPRALSLAEPFLAQEDVRNEAALAVVSLAPYACGTAPQPTLTALRRVADLPVEAQVKQSARELADVISGFNDYIMAWQVTGPFMQEGKDGQALFDVAFPPETADSSQVKWKTMPAGQRKDRPWQLDLGPFYGGDNRVAYARTWLHVDAAKPAQLEFGSDDGLKVWLNGKPVVTANRGGDVIPGTHKAAVTLQPGANALLIKVTQWTSGWGFCARVANPDGTPIHGLRAVLQP